jgi:hypothetical protein
MVVAQQKGFDLKGYENNQIFGSELANVVSTFARIYDVKSKRSRGRNRYRFTKMKTS